MQNVNDISHIKYSSLDYMYYQMLMRCATKWDYYIRTFKLYHYALDITNSHHQALQIAFKALHMQTDGQANIYYDGEEKVL